MGVYTYIRVSCVLGIINERKLKPQVAITVVGPEGSPHEDIEKSLLGILGIFDPYKKIFVVLRPPNYSGWVNILFTIAVDTKKGVNHLDLKHKSKTLFSCPTEQVNYDRDVGKIFRIILRKTIKSLEG